MWPSEVGGALTEALNGHAGAIDEEEIWRIVRRLGIRVGGRLGLHALLEKVDLDGSGEIEFDEFSQLLCESAAVGGVQADFAASLARVATTKSPWSGCETRTRGGVATRLAAALLKLPCVSRTGATLAVRWSTW